MHILIDYNTKCALSKLNFQFFSAEEIHKLSVKEITNPQALDRLLNPLKNGLYDLALGPLDKNDICLTCNLDYFQCPGHFGHINLVLPVYNPVFFKELIKLLRVSCLSCHQLLTNKLEKSYFVAKMQLINLNLIEYIPLVDDLYTKILNTNEPKLINKVSFKKDFDDLITFIQNEYPSNGSSTCRNVVKARIELLKEFLDSKLKANRQVCSNCCLPLRQLRAEHNSKLFYAKGVSARILKKNKITKLKMSIEDELIDEINGLEIEEDESEEQVNQEKIEAYEAGKEEKSLKESEKKLEKLTGQSYLTPVETRKHLKKLFENEREILNLILGNYDLDHDQSELFFFDVIAVPPSKYRPISQFKEQRFENAQTTQLAKLIQQNLAIKELLHEIINSSQKLDESQIIEAITNANNKKLPTLQEKLQNAWLQMQTIVNVLYDSDMDKINIDSPAGLKQLLEKKEGLFRKHMMGKRVNYAGRSVISPDVYIGTDEIGIPEIFAKKLTYPQPINSANFWEMKQLILNGPDIYPGATQVEFGNGNIVRLKGKDYESRLAFAKQMLAPESSMNSNLDIKIVHRHLKNGDILLFNRQPTLHRPSVMAHRARVLPNEKTLRMHYSNCKAYNADFDGDEMNAHLPQNEIARSEAQNLMISSEHYLVPKDGTPLGGLIHDHVVSGTALSMRDRFFDKSDYQMLVFNSFNQVKDEIRLLPPAILKPKQLWTGKQVISTLIINLLPKEKGLINLESKSKIAEKSWYDEKALQQPNWSNSSAKSKHYSTQYMNESYVLIRDGNLLCGVLDKAHYGSSSFSLVHCCYELYGGAVAGQLLTCLGRLFTTFLQIRGFTLGVEDVMIRDDLKKPMSKIVKKAKKCGYEVLAQAFNSSNPDDKEELINQYKRRHMDPDESYMKEIDLAYKGAVDSFQNGLTKLCFPNGLIKKFPFNNLQLMIQSGAKGSSVNSMQMSCLLGQQELEGRRPRLMVNGNTLPSFLPYDSSPISGGFICNSFMTGLTPQEYFFHCMAGREGLVDTAVKTSRSGYLQRCLIKHLEGLVVNYDLTVRDSDNSVIQFQYGEDSLSVEKTQFLSEKQFPFLVDNHSIITSNKREVEKIRQYCYHESIYKKLDRIKEWRAEIDLHHTRRSSAFLNFSKSVTDENCVKGKTHQERIKYMIDQWKSMSDAEKKIYKKGKFRTHLPITSNFNTDRYLGAISEKLQDRIDSYVEKNHSQVYSNNLDSNEFKELIYLKSIRSCITPGDSVGILAAQSIGEPSTQMTLNTFHFAGRGDMNVTLGIPRLREILMVASANIKTPSMQVPVFLSKEAKADNLKSQFTRTLLWDCFHKLDIEQTLDLNRRKAWLTKVRFELVDQDEIQAKSQTSIKLYEILNYIETKFVKNLCIAINKKYNQISSSSLLHTTTVREKSMKNFSNINHFRKENEHGDDDDEEDDEANELNEIVNETGDTMAEKLLNKKNDEFEYDGEDQEREEVEKNESDEEDDEVNGELKKSAGDENGNEEEIANGINDDHVENIRGIKKKRKELDMIRVNRILNISNMIEDYKYDTEHMQWFEVVFRLDAFKPRLDLYSVIQKLAKHSYISKVEGIKRCFLNKSTLPEDNGCMKIITEGINVNEIIKNSDILDVYRLYMNDIHQMASTFGIEAAVKVIINEIKQVFGAYGIHVDYRHLSLIADYMTFEGVYKPFNRIGIKSNASPLQKMSFETCLQFFKDAYLLGQQEELKSPSACLVTGRMVKAGTGAFDILTKLV